ncbi:MAG TPA: Ig-like domain-containing protein, partial [Steroidobacteraceae bacterium]|nr:Ig-like domain-containing protein [Steroidobacteraceae bacterium]
MNAVKSKLYQMSWMIGLCIAFATTSIHAASLTLLSSAPASNATDISRTDNLTLQFSAPVASSSVTASTVTLQSIAGVQKVSLSVSGAVVSVRPLTPLLPWTNYTLSA